MLNDNDTYEMRRYNQGYTDGQFDAAVDINIFIRELNDTIEEFEDFSEDTGADISGFISQLRYVVDRLNKIVKELT